MVGMPRRDDHFAAPGSDGAPPGRGDPGHDRDDAQHHSGYRGRCRGVGGGASARVFLVGGEGKSADRQTRLRAKGININI